MIPITQYNQRIRENQKLNALSALPGAGVAIGFATVVLNTAKIFSTLSELRILNSTSYKDPQELRNLNVKKIFIKAKIFHHLTYIGIGLVRLALPIIGGALLWSAKVAPINKYAIVEGLGDLRLQNLWGKFRVTQERPEIPLHILIIPVIGQVVAAALILYRSSKIAHDTIKLALVAIQSKIGNPSDKAIYTETKRRLYRDLTEQMKIMGELILAGGLPVVGAFILMNNGFEEQKIPSAPKPKQKPRLAINAWRGSPSHYVQAQMPPDRADFGAPIMHSRNAHKTVALTLGDAHISGSEWEGDSIGNTIHFWKLVLNKSDGLKAALEETERNEILADFQDIDFLRKAENSEAGAKASAEYMTKQIIERGRCIVPLIAKMSNHSGHISALVFQKNEDGNIELYHLNIGEGSRQFPIIRQGHKTQRSFRSQKRLLIPKLFNPEALPLTQWLAGLILSIRETDPTSKNAKWETTLFQNFTKLISTPIEGQIPLSHIVTEQRSGTCPEQLARLIIRDRLIHLNPAGESDEIQLIKYKRMIAKGKYEALKLLNQLLNEKTITAKFARTIICATAHTFSEDQKKGVFNNLEIEVLSRHIDQMLARVSTEVPAILLPENNTLDVDASIKVSLPKPGTTVELKKQLSAIYLTFPFSFDYRTGVQTVSELKELMSYSINSFSPDFDIIHSIVRFLPVPSATQPTAPYSKLNAQEANELLDFILKISTHLTQQHKNECKKKESTSSFTESLVTKLHLTAIANELLPAFPELKAGGYSLQLERRIMTSSTFDALGIQMGDETTRLKQILDYFEAQEVKKSLFGWDHKTFPVDQALRVNPNQMDPDIRSIHDYLQQFRTDSSSNLGKIVLNTVADRKIALNGRDVEVWKSFKAFCAELTFDTLQDGDTLLCILLAPNIKFIGKNTEENHLKSFIEHFKSYCKCKAPDVYAKLNESEEFSLIFNLNNYSYLSPTLPAQFSKLRRLMILTHDTYEPPSEYFPPTLEMLRSSLSYTTPGHICVAIAYSSGSRRELMLYSTLLGKFSNMGDTENTSLLEGASSKDLEDKSAAADLLRMNRCAQTSLGELISWVNLHPNERSDSFYQWVERLVFRDYLYENIDSTKLLGLEWLSKIVRDEPQIRVNFHEMILSRINITPWNEYNDICFWARLALWFETRIDQDPELKMDRDFIEKVSTLVEGKIPKEVSTGLTVEEKQWIAIYHLHLAYLNSYRPEPNSPQLERYIIHSFCKKLFEIQSENRIDDFTNEIHFKTSAPWESYKNPTTYTRTVPDFQIRSKLLQKEIYTLLSAPECQEQRVRIGNACLKAAGIPAVGAIWESSGKTCLRAQINGDLYELNIYLHGINHFGLISVNGIPTRTTILSPSQTAYVKGLGIDLSVPYLKVGGSIIATDGSFEIIPNSNGNPGVKKRFHTISPNRLEYMDLTDQYSLRNSLESIPVFIQKYHFWRDAQTLYVIDSQDRLVAQYESEQGFIKKSGQETLVLQDNRFVSAELKAFWGYAHPENRILFWAKVKKIAQIELPDLGGLKFNVRKNSYESVQYSGHKLAEKQGQVGPLEVRGALSLVHKQNPAKKLVIIPSFPIANVCPLDRDASAKRNFVFGCKPIGKGHFVYEVNPKDQSLYTSDPRATLYLSYLFQSYGEFTQAKHYLDRVPQIEAAEFDKWKDIVKGMFDNKIKSPQAVAFILHLVRKLNDDGYPIDEEEFFQIKISETISAYHQYSHTEKNSLPDGLILSDFELGEFCKTYRPSGGSAVLTKLESCLFKSVDGYHIVAALGSVKFPINTFDHSNFIQYYDKGHSCLEKNFYWFYKDAKGLNGPDLKALCLVKLEYLAHRDEELSVYDTALLQILYSVHKFPDRYPDLVPNGNGYLGEMIPEILIVYKEHIATSKPKQESTCTTVIRKPSPIMRPVVAALPILASMLGKSIQAELLLDKYFVAETKHIFSAAKQFLLMRRPRGKIALKMITRMQNAFDTQLKNKTTDIFSLKNNNIEPLLHDLSADIAKLRKHTAELYNDICQLANTAKLEQLTPEQRTDYHAHRLEKAGREQPELSLSDILLSVGTRNAAKLRQSNPFISDEDLVTLANLSLQYMEEESHINQLEEAQSVLKSNSPDSIQRAGEILAKSRTYQPEKWPELLFYEYSTGLLLRKLPDQAQLLIDLFELVFKEEKSQQDQNNIRRISFEFQAGGGKTKVISVILAAKAMAEGKIPVFISLPPLVDVVRQDLREMLIKVFNKGTRKIAINLETVLSKAVMDAYTAMLVECKRIGECVVITPETYHAINLGFQQALRSRDLELVNSIRQFQRILKTDALFLIDEAHHNIDALLQANLALGEQTPIHKRQLLLISFAYAIMTGADVLKPRMKDGRLLSDVLKIRENQQAQIAEADKQEALDLVSACLLDGIVFETKLNSKQISELKIYVRDAKASPPQFLINLPEKNLVALVRALRLHILPHNLQKVGQMDYGVAIDPTDPVVTPREQKNPSNSKYENPYIACTLTCQSAYQEGITSPKYFGDLLLRLKTMRGKKTLIEQIQTEFQIDLSAITSSTLQNKRRLADLMSKLHRYPPFVRLYLQEFALEQVKIHWEKMTSTGADLVTASWASVEFSATLGDKALYPCAYDETIPFWDDPEFLANVTQRLCMKHNNQALFIAPSTPKGLLENLFNQSPELMARVEGLIDLGYWCKGCSSFAWAEAFNQFARIHKSGFAGSLYFEKNSKNEKRLHFLPIDSKTPIKLKTTNLAKELPKLGVTNETVFKIYAPDETTGTDLQISPNAKMIVTIGENTTLSDAAQAVLRMRQFLADNIQAENLQSALFVVPKQQEALIIQKDIPPMHAVLVWMMENEEKKLKNTIIANAKQDIANLARSWIMQTITASEFPLNEFESYKYGLLYRTSTNPFDMYGNPVQSIDVRKYLQDYAKSVFNNAELPEDIIKEFSGQVDAIVTKAKTYIDSIEDQAGSLSATSKQHVAIQQIQQQQQQQELQLQQQAISTSRLHPFHLLDYAEKTLSLNEFSLQTNVKPGKQLLHQASKAKGPFPDAPQNLYIADNVFKTIYESDYVKSADFILIIQEKSKRTYISCSNHDAEQWSKQLKYKQVKAGLRACIYGLDGKVIQNGKGEARLQDLGDDPEFNDIILYCNLLNGVVSNPQALLLRVKDNRDGYKKAWDNRKKLFLDGGYRFKDSDFMALLDANTTV